MRTQFLISTFLVICVSGTACLKTRSQLRDDPDEGDRRPVPAHVQEVQPQGQYIIDEIRAELTRLNGRVEDLERVSQPQNSEKDDTKKLETRIVELEHAQAQMIETLKKLQDNVTANADPSEFLDQAKKQYVAGDFDGAIQNLNKYIAVPKARNTEDAIFLRAEAYFQLKDFKKAILDYSKFPEKYPRSSHLPAALLKIGQSFERIGSADDAKAFYQELLDKFPKSPEARSLRKQR